MAQEKLKDKAMEAFAEEELLKLDNQLCFALYVCSKEVIKRYKPLLEPFGLTYTGYITMMALWDKDNVNVKELGARLFLDSGTLTPLLKKLEAQEYIERTRDPEDERNIIVTLTEKGRNLKGKISCVPMQMLDDMEMGSIKAVVLMKTLRQLMDEFKDEDYPEDAKKPAGKKKASGERYFWCW